MIYFISDLHFGHKSILKYTKRPFRDLDHMHEELIKRWNEYIKSELRFMERRPPRIKGEYLLHGHTHTKYKTGNIKAGLIHIGVDANDFYPVSAKEIESIIGKANKNK